MAIFPKYKQKPPKMAHHDLGHYFRTSMAVGPLVPIMVQECLPGDSHYFDINSLVNTQALLSPLYGSFRLKIMAFFAGTSLYIPKLWRNGSMQMADGTLDANYPTFTIDTTYFGSDGKIHFVDPSSLYAYLGINPYYADPFDSEAGGEQMQAFRYKEFNAIPLLMYADIYRTYFVNRQEKYCYFMGGYGNNQGLIHNLAIKSLDNLFLNLPSDGGNINNKLSGLFNTGMTSYGYPLGGLALGTYMPDMMNVILNKDFYEKNVTSVQVSTSSGNFQIDQLVTAKKLWNSRNKDAISSGTFKDWVRMHFGVTPKIMDDMPTFLGATSTDIAFEDIRATTTQTVGDATQYLGDKASSGLGFGSSRTFRLDVDRPGYLMVLAQIVPYVDYYQRLERYMLHTKLSDSFRPEYNGIGLQDVLVSDLNNSYSSLNAPLTDDSPNVSQWVPTWTEAVGKQPAWIEYMTKVNKLRGTFCSTEKSWVLARDMASGTNSNPVLGTTTTAYIHPEDWNQPFAVQDSTAQNFLVQFRINHKVRSTVLKRIVPKF